MVKRTKSPSRRTATFAETGRTTTFVKARCGVTQTSAEPLKSNRAKEQISVWSNSRWWPGQRILTGIAEQRAASTRSAVSPTLTSGSNSAAAATRCVAQRPSSS